MNYWSRITPPSTFASAALTFDDLVVDTFRQRMKLPALTDVARNQLMMPVRDGGFGLSSLIDVSPAYYCGLAQAFKSIRPLVSSLDVLTLDVPFVKSLSLSLNSSVSYFS